ncbi:MAG: hypothetical protein HDR33_06200 [Treponema sp.]|nr:hypothetical protein [Treponema sp.]
MFNEEYLTKKLIFSKKARTAFSLLAGWGARKESARICAQKRKSALQGFSSRIFGALIVGVCLSFVSCANIFQDKVAKSNDGTPATLGEMFVGGVTVGKLDTPSEIHVSLYEFSNRIRISWSPVKYAEYYSLERAIVTERNEKGEWKTPDESEYELLEHSEFLYATTFMDIVIEDSMNDPLDCENEKYGYAFFYRVRAENPRLGYEESEYANSSYGALLPPPSGTKASAGESDEYIEVTWIKSSGTARYEIYRSENEDGTNSTRVGTVTSDMDKYKDEAVSSYGGKDLFYTVCAVSSETGERSVPSSVALGYTLLPGAPKAASNVRVTKGKGHGDSPKSIEIEWDSIEGDGITYTVYRSSSESSTMRKLGEGSGSYADSKDLKSNVYYYYYVQTSKIEMKDESDTEGTLLKGPMSKSGPDDASPAEGFILSEPSTVEVQKIRGESEYRISFTPVIGDANFSNKTKAKYDNKYEYVVLGGGTQSGNFSEVKTASSSALEFADGKYSMKVSPFGFYKMKVKYNGEESKQTSVVAPAPYEARDVYVTRAALVGSPDDYVPKSTTSTTEPGTNANGVHPVKITWKAPEGGADAYNIYRSEKQDSGFRKIKDSPIPANGGTDFEYIDKNDSAKAGSIYYYYVLSLNSLGQGVEKSAIDTPTLDDNKIIKTKNADNTPCGRGWGWGALSAWQYMREERKTVESSQKKLTLMHKSNNLDKVGSETINGNICGTLSYTAKVEGLGARITMPYTNYADSYISNNKNLGIYFLFNGNTNTTSNMSANGNMDGTVTCNGMYPGSVIYNNVQIKGGAAGGGTYGVIRNGIDSNAVQVDWKAGDK